MKENNKIILGVFMNLKLLKRWAKYQLNKIDFGGTILNWFQSYLTNRNIKSQIQKLSFIQINK